MAGLVLLNGTHGHVLSTGFQPIVSIAIGFALVKLGRYQSRDEAPFLTRLFVEATEAKSKAKAVAAKSAAPKSAA